MKKERINNNNSMLNSFSYLNRKGLQNTYNLKLTTNYGFTLVELIVVVTILAILATVGFVSYSGYLAGTRDTNRISQIKAISDGLEMYRTRHDLPLPDDYVEVTASGETIAYQGYVGKNVLETIEYTSEGKDPKDGTYFSYYLTKDKKYYELMAFLEEEDNLQANAKSGQTHRSAPTTKSVGGSFCVHPNGCNTVQAIDYTTRYPTVYGKKLGILTDMNNTPIQEVDEVVNSGYLDIVNTDKEFVARLGDNDELLGTGIILNNLGYFALVGGKNCSSKNLGCINYILGNYPLKENANNLLGDNNGKEEGNISYTGEYAIFDGSSDILIGKNYNYLFNYSHEFTFSASIYLTSLDHHSTIISNMDNDDNAKGIGILVNGSNKHIYGELINNRNADNAISVITESEIELNKWYHIVMTYDGSGKSSGIKIYINGKEEKLNPNPKGRTKITDTSISTKNLLIGNRNASDDHYRFNGYMKNIKLFTKKITDYKIKRLYEIDK